jgi:hypothetical protein
MQKKQAPLQACKIQEIIFKVGDGSEVIGGVVSTF